MTFHQRVTAYGWCPERAATQPIRIKRNDREWVKIARKNGISHQVYYYRVDEMFWSPEKAATIPVMSTKEVSEIGNQAKAEYKEIMDERKFKDKTNMFNLTPQHYKIAIENGILKNTVRSRVINYGWTIHEAITVPIKGFNFARPKGYFEYLKIAKKNEIKTSTYSGRIKRGWTPEDSSSKRPGDSKGYRRPDKKWMEIAVQNGINLKTYISRINSGWSPEDAATISTLKKGEYLNKQTEENANKGFEKFRRR
jgi:hypothetical protein